LETVSERLLAHGVSRARRSGSKLTVEIGNDRSIVGVDLAVVVRSNLLVVLVDLPVVGVNTALVLAVNPVDFALPLSFSPALSSPKLTVELSCVKASRHQVRLVIVRSPAGS
jgi:hypothetical protein